MICRSRFRRSISCRNAIKFLMTRSGLVIRQLPRLLNGSRGLNRRRQSFLLISVFIVFFALLLFLKTNYEQKFITNEAKNRSFRQFRVDLKLKSNIQYSIYSIFIHRTKRKTKFNTLKSFSSCSSFCFSCSSCFLFCSR